MTDNSSNSLHTTISSSNQSASNANNSDSGSQYILLASSDPTKIKLKRNYSNSNASSSSYALPSATTSADGNTITAHQISNGFPAAVPTTTTNLNRLQVRVPPPAYPGNNSTAGMGFKWHTPYPSPLLTTGGSSSNSTSSLSSRPSSPTAATSSSSLRSRYYHGSMSNNVYPINQGQSVPSAAQTISQTQRWLNSYQAMNSAVGGGPLSSAVGGGPLSSAVGGGPLSSAVGGGPLSSAVGLGPSSRLYSSYNDILAPPVSNASSSSNSSASLSSTSSNAAQTSNSFPGMPLNSYIVNNNQQSAIQAIPSPPSGSKRARKRPAIVKINIKSSSKKPRGRPKKEGVVKKGSPSSTDPLAFALNNMVSILKLNIPGTYPKKQHPATTTSLSAALTSMASTTTMPVQTSNAPTSYFEPSTNTEVVGITPPRVTANIPMPPNWLEHSEDTIMSLFTFKKYSVSSTTSEYQTISNMLHPVQVKGIEQIVNPDLWKRFVNTRKEMLRSKTDDLNILPKLGLDEREVMRCAHFTLNYAKDPLLTPYSCNMALLFHCTRSQSSINNILSQGLDERLSNISGGLLGKGIYFADDPQKSLQYDGTGCILIFAVLLGDCISVDHFNNKSGLVREPEKVKQQKRNFNDQFFDSIVARPAGYNEYVIYNRYQCCPLYQVEYVRSTPHMQFMSNFNNAAQNLPPIAWIPEGPNYAMPVQKMFTQWPFYAVDLFEKMGVTPPKDDDDDDDTDVQNELPALTSTSTPQISIDEKLAMLISLGYYDECRNKEILLRFNNDLDQAVNYLLDNENVFDAVIDQPSTSAAASLSSSAFPSISTIHYSSESSKSTFPKKSILTIDLIDDDSACSDVEVITENDLKPCKKEFKPVDLPMDLPDEIAEWALEFDTDYIKTEIEEKPEKSSLSPAPLEMVECLICCNEYESFEISPSLWKELQCSHKLCLACYSNILTTRTTISGVQHTFVKCPFCQGITGIEIGTCPDVQMNVSLVPQSCESYESTNSIRINYFIDSGHKLNRTAYLPNNAEGQEVLNLLRKAWDRRLCFTIGTSVTTGQENVIVWNIHHKTSLRGGTSSYGYPDPSYIERVKWELKAYGIE